MYLSFFHKFMQYTAKIFFRVAGRHGNIFQIFHSIPYFGNHCKNNFEKMEKFYIRRLRQKSKVEKDKGKKGFCALSDTTVSNKSLDNFRRMRYNKKQKCSKEQEGKTKL